MTTQKPSYLAKASQKSPPREHSDEKCSICNTMHATQECHRLLGMNVEERVEQLKARRCCFNCLKPGHNFFNCPEEKPKCDTCGKKHNTLLHGKNPFQPRRQNQPEGLPVRQPRTAEENARPVQNPVVQAEAPAPAPAPAQNA